MTKYIYIFILSLSFLSCNSKLEKELEYIYTASAETENDTLQIDSFKILSTKKVDFSYFQNIGINNLKYVISLNQLIIEKEKQRITLLEKNIANRNKLIKLNKNKKNEYLIQIEYDQRRLEESKLKLDNAKYENNLTHQKIVLIRAGVNQKKGNEFELVKFVFSGKINSKSRIDTMELMISKEFGNKFIKNNMFSDYKGK
ncbi:hypothetical protein [uncultured Aquimarina sp.]|uniref:hypothetical protein n=1 Tax=uncultured Aquimarina sp. TaxID=575652 RepID=UPI00262457E9|nr:hypothetical protein [uncultured Aquimarina sp.]